MEPTDDRLELFFSQSLDGFFFMMLDEPIAWNDRADKDALLDYALEQTGGVLAGPNGAARLLGLSRSTAWSRMRKLGITLPRA